jgi:hypothetical protein
VHIVSVWVEMELPTRRRFGRDQICDGNGLVRYSGIVVSGTFHAEAQRILPDHVNNGK